MELSITTIIIDALVFGGYTYSIFGNAYRKYIEKEDIMNDIEKLEGRTDITNITCLRTENVSPSYVHLSGGAMIPVGGGNVTIEKDLLWFLRNEHRKEILYSKDSFNFGFDKYYINDMEELNKLLKEKGIKKTQFPVTFPLAVYNKTFNQPIYYNKLYCDTSKKSVYSAIDFAHRLPLTMTILCGCLLYTGYSWIKYKYKTYYGEYIPHSEYPIFHPKRYSERY